MNIAQQFVGPHAAILVSASQALANLRVKQTDGPIYCDLERLHGLVHVTIVAGDAAELVALGQRLIDLAADLEIESEA